MFLLYFLIKINLKNDVKWCASDRYLMSLVVECGDAKHAHHYNG